MLAGFYESLKICSRPIIIKVSPEINKDLKIQFFIPSKLANQIQKNCQLIHLNFKWVSVEYGSNGTVQCAMSVKTIWSTPICQSNRTVFCVNTSERDIAIGLLIATGVHYIANRTWNFHHCCIESIITSRRKKLSCSFSTAWLCRRIARPYGANHRWTTQFPIIKQSFDKAISLGIPDSTGSDWCARLCMQTAGCKTLAARVVWKSEWRPLEHGAHGQCTATTSVDTRIE